MSSSNLHKCRQELPLLEDLGVFECEILAARCAGKIATCLLIELRERNDYFISATIERLSNRLEAAQVIPFFRKRGDQNGVISPNSNLGVELIGNRSKSCHRTVVIN